MEEILCKSLGVEVIDNLYTHVCILKISVDTDSDNITTNININKIDLGIIFQDEDSLYFTLKNCNKSNDIEQKESNNSIAFNIKLNTIELNLNGRMYLCTDSSKKIIDYLLEELGYLNFDIKDILTLNYYWLDFIRSVNIHMSTRVSIYIPVEYSYKILTDTTLLEMIKSDNSISDNYYLMSELIYFENYRMLDYFRIMNLNVIRNYKYKDELSIMLSLMNLYTLRDYIIYLNKGNPSIRHIFKHHGEIMEEAMQPIIIYIEMIFFENTECF